MFRTDGTVDTLAQIEAPDAGQAGRLTSYDMCKTAGRGMVMTNVRVLEKQGGKSRDWTADIDKCPPSRAQRSRECDGQSRGRRGIRASCLVLTATRPSQRCQCQPQQGGRTRFGYVVRILDARK